MPSRHRILLVAVAAATILGALGTRAAEPLAPAPASEPLRRAAELFVVLEKQEVERLSRLLDGLVADPSVVDPFKARNREKLLARAKPKFEKDLAIQGVTHWYFIDPEPTRTCFLRVHSPTLFGDVIGRPTLSRAIATHDIGSGKELGKTAFALRVVKPVKVGGRVIGYMELAEEIASFLGKMKEMTGCDFALLIDKHRIDRNCQPGWRREPGRGAKKPAWRPNSQGTAVAFGLPHG